MFIAGLCGPDNGSPVLFTALLPPLKRFSFVRYGDCFSDIERSADCVDVDRGKLATWRSQNRRDVYAAMAADQILRRLKAEPVAPQV
jgi:hypothetical protein